MAKIGVKISGDIALVHAAGRITLDEGSSNLRESLRGLIEEGKNKIVLNLSRVKFMDSSGFGALVECYTSARKHGGDLRIASPSFKVIDILSLTKMDKIIKSYNSENEAIKSFAK